MKMEHVRPLLTTFATLTLIPCVSYMPLLLLPPPGPVLFDEFVDWYMKRGMKGKK